MKFSIRDELWWHAPLRLVSWAGYQSRLGPYGSVDSAKPSDGSVDLIFAPEGRGIEPLSASETALVSWFEAHEQAVSQAVKDGIIRWCAPQCAERKRDFDFDGSFPSINDEEDLRQHIGLYAINIHQLDCDGMPYIGYEFGCEWEEEHGLGALMHGTRVVRVGFADTAFQLWQAEEDAENQPKG